MEVKGEIRVGELVTYTVNYQCGPSVVVGKLIKLDRTSGQVSITARHRNGLPETIYKRTVWVRRENLKPYTPAPSPEPVPQVAYPEEGE